MPNNPNIERVTFVAENIYEGMSPTKIDLWIQEGNEVPETNCACRRGYSLF